jgi:CheY-like chemotaxis protein
MLQEDLPSYAHLREVKTILLVEDDEGNRDLYTEAFALLTPYLVQVVRNGPEALHFVTQIKPNLFILDYHLAGTNGIQLYDQLHTTPGLESIPAIIIISSTSEEAAHEIESRHLLRVMKPFHLDNLLDTIKQALA